MGQALAAGARVFPPEPRHYLGHLAAVAADQRVVVQHDIRRDDGEVLVPRGGELSPETVERLGRRGLAESLLPCVDIPQPIDAGAVVNVWSRLRETCPDLDQLEQRMGLFDDFETVARTAPLPRVVWQVATVMFVRRPDWFQQSVAGAWLAVALGREAGLVDVDVLRAFAAAFSRDLGFMFIDARHIDRPGYLEGGTRAWRAIQSHVETGQDLWLRSDAPGPWAAAVGRSIYEHHERVNATGYPDRLPADALDDIGQIVGMSDLLASVRLKRFRDSGRTVKDALPMILVSSDCFPQGVIDAAVRVLARSGLRSTAINDFRSKSDLVDHLLERSHLIRRLTQVLQDLPSFESVVPRGQPLPPPSPMTRATTSTVQMLLRSGVSQSELTAWLDSVSNGQSTARMHELCEMSLQQSEALWRVEQIRRLLAEYVEFHQPRANSPVHRVLTQLQNPLSL